MRWDRFTWIALAVWPLLALGQDATKTPPPAERRAQIGAQREAVEVRHRQALQACAKEFAQTACTERARRDRRRDIDALDRELATLNLAERRRRAAESSQRVAEKQRAAERQAAPPAAAAASVPRSARPVASPASAPRRRTPETQAAAASAAAQAASARQQARNRRLAEQKAHAETVQQRNAERALKKPPSPPLPAAPASALR